MIKWILQKIVGSKNQREVRRIRPTVARINEIEEALQREPVEKLLEFRNTKQFRFSHRSHIKIVFTFSHQRNTQDSLAITKRGCGSYSLTMVESLHNIGFRNLSISPVVATPMLQ